MSSLGTPGRPCAAWIRKGGGCSGGGGGCGGGGCGGGGGGGGGSGGLLVVAVIGISILIVTQGLLQTVK